MAMKKGIKITLITLVSILAIIIIVVGSLAIYVVCSPDPVVWLLRQNFGGQPQTVNVENYEEIKSKVEIHKDLTYPSLDGKNKYDIYFPKEGEKPLPVIIWIHGGAFVAGTKDGIENYAVMLASEGLAVVGVDYEWAPEIKYPGQVRQVEECISELYKVKADYRLDMNYVILAGDSAGAHIAAQAVLLASNFKYRQEIGVDSALDYDHLKGALLYCGPYDVSEMLDTGNATLDFFASRIGWALMGEKNWKDGVMISTTTIKDYVTDRFPPTFITDGNSGSFESQGKGLEVALTNKGVWAPSLFFEKEEYGEVGHEYQFNIGDGGAGSACYEKTISFLKSLYLI